MLVAPFDKTHLHLIIDELLVLGFERHLLERDLSLLVHNDFIKTFPLLFGPNDGRVLLPLSILVLFWLVLLLFLVTKVQESVGEGRAHHLVIYDDIVTSNFVLWLGGVSDSLLTILHSDPFLVLLVVLGKSSEIQHVTPLWDCLFRRDSSASIARIRELLLKRLLPCVVFSRRLDDSIVSLLLYFISEERKTASSCPSHRALQSSILLLGAAATYVMLKTNDCLIHKWFTCSHCLWLVIHSFAHCNLLGLPLFILCPFQSFYCQ